ncbi:MAG: DNA translocase FtsK 4TM domain-containing protein [Alphaproteobacteria bacterium]|nr:DNA translocase FtsK 4TM domain-containing protein [Alphaproteobacteria bacterium]
MARPLIRSRSRKSQALLPRSLYEGLARFVHMIFGGLVLGAALCIALALATYAPGDPSLNAAFSVSNPGMVRNLCGVWGAYGADVLWQLFGLGAFILPFVIGAWGWRVAKDLGVEMFWWRVLATFGSMLSASIALSGMRLPALKGLRLEGALGKIIERGASELLYFSWAHIAVALLFSILTILAVYLSCALTPEEWIFLGQTLRSFAAAVAEQTHKLLNGLWGLARGQRDENPLDDLEGDEEESGETGEEESEKEAEGEGKGKKEAEGGEEANEEKKPKEKKPIVKRPAVTARQPRLALDVTMDYPLPPLDFLRWPEKGNQQELISEEILEKNAKLLENVLEDFGVHGQILKVSPGPVVTLYELEPSPGTRAARVISLADDIARNMSAISVRVAIMPGRNVIGIELPNTKRETVYLRELLSAPAYHETKAVLPLVLGKDIAGGPVIADLSKMPHLLIAGTTGSGKSVAINTMILSLLYHHPPQKCRFIMIDPKMLELSVYEGIPHLLAPVVTEPKKAILALRWTVREMEERYRAMSKLGVRNIDGYNVRLRQASKNGENLMRTVQTGFDRETGKPIYEEQPLDLTELPFIVVIVDEMADLMMVAGKEIEAAIQRLAQMARAAGIHIIMATQRPSVDVVTGTIKANFPTRISFQVSSKIDSRTILGEQGAEQLLGQGDMLYMAGGGRITRVHGPLVRDDEVEQIVKFLKAQGEPEYLDEVTEDDGSAIGESGAMGDSFGGESSGDGLYDKAVDVVLRERKASTSFIQRQLQIGYNKAATLVERMEKDGLIGPASATGKREIFGRNLKEDE